MQENVPKNESNTRALNFASKKNVESIDHTAKSPRGRKSETNPQLKININQCRVNFGAN